MPLRRGAVTLTQMLARRATGSHAIARRSSSGKRERRRRPPRPKGFEGGEKGFLLVWLEAALKAVHDGREKLVTRDAGEPPEIVRERELVDEFVSLRLLEMLAESQRSLAKRRAQRRRRRSSPTVCAAASKRRCTTSSPTASARSFLRADRRSEADVDAYLARAARLKKHFEEVLFLDRETEQLDERVQQWMATVGALLGGIVAFVAIQVALTHRRRGARGRLGPHHAGDDRGLGYAARHHMREFCRGWLAGKVVRFHAQRISRCRIPSRHLPSKDVIVEAREWCHQATTSRPDPLNPERAPRSAPPTSITCTRVSSTRTASFPARG